MEILIILIFIHFYKKLKTSGVSYVFNYCKYVSKTFFKVFSKLFHFAFNFTRSKCSSNRSKLAKDNNRNTKNIPKSDLEKFHLKNCCYADELHLRLINDEDRLLWKVWLDNFTSNDPSAKRSIIIYLDKAMKEKKNEILDSGHLLLSLPSVFFVIEKTRKELKSKGLLKIYQILYRE